MSVIIELSQAQLDSIAQQQSGSTVPPATNVQTFEHGAQQPVQPDVNGKTWVADLTFNGKRFATQGLTGASVPFYFRFVMPNDFNAIGWQGKVAQIQYSEHAEFGGQQFTKTCAFNMVGDFSSNIRYGSSGNYQVSFGFDYPNAIKAMPGEIWYLMVDYKMQNGQPSAKPADDGDMQCTPSAPGVV